jgi:hypothetical protein
VNDDGGPLSNVVRFSTMPVMDNSEYDRLRQVYKEAVDVWVSAIRNEESLATPDHSMVAMEHWDAANFKEQDAQKKVIAAKEAYNDALRLFNYGI